MYWMVNRMSEHKHLGKCHQCKDDIYSDQVVEYENVLYCGTQCIVDELLKEKVIIDLSK